jgi:hypothetical protein
VLRRKDDRKPVPPHPWPLDAGRRHAKHSETFIVATPPAGGGYFYYDDQSDRRLGH